MTVRKEKLLGQYFTPPDLAKDIVQATRTRYKDGAISILEPAFGKGAFLDALKVADVHYSKFCGVELDGSLLSECPSADVLHGDFTRMIPEQYDLILTNPPYTRHHLIPAEEKERMALRIREELGISLDRYAGLHCYFILLADRWLKEDGIAVWLLPAEILDVNYGQALKFYFTHRVQLLQVHLYNTQSSSLFPGATVSSCVVVYRKRNPDAREDVLFTYGNRMGAPEISKTVPSEALDDRSKWTKIFMDNSSSGEDACTLSDYFSIKRGIATGDNRYFILTREEIEKRGLPIECFTPILANRRDLDQTVIENGADGFPVIKNKRFVLDTNLPLPEIKIKYPNLYSYLLYGEDLGVRERYLVKKRKIWYKQECRAPAPFYCTYIARNNGGSFFRFIWNKSDMIATNNFLMLYPKQVLLFAMEQGAISQGEVFRALTKISSETFLGESRQYAAGMAKLEPSELGNIKIQLRL